jgi:hypothetical protein
MIHIFLNNSQNSATTDKNQGLNRRPHISNHAVLLVLHSHSRWNKTLPNGDLGQFEKVA